MGRSRRRWGWHELDAKWADWLVAEASIPSGALVLDVGAGRGALTSVLLDAGARVVAVEAHAAKADELRARFGESIVLVRADARDLRLPRRPFHVVANPPFGLTSALLTRLVHRGSRLATAHLIVQEQAARRWAGATAPGRGGWGRAFEVSLGPRLPRSAFRPRPQVDTRVLVIERHG